ncbi:MAG: tail fiber domain-containing protein [Pyrinomonadaceae bacterium]
MKKTAIVFTLVFFFLFHSTASAQSSEFSYQGQLQNASALANGVFDFEFALFGSAFGGSQLGSTQPRSGVNVANGIFSVSLDFGNQFDGTSRFLEIRVRQSGGGAYTTLSPRQTIASSPYAVRSLDAQNAVNSQTAANAANATNAVTATTANNFTGPLAGDVTGTQGSTTVARLRGTNVAVATPTNGQVLKFNSGANQWQADTDNIGSGGGGTITGVTAGTGLTGGGNTGSVTVSIANGGITNALMADGAVTAAKLADASVSNAKIVDVAGGKITGSITTATIPGANVIGPVGNAASAVNFSGPLAGDVVGTQSATVIANNAVTDPKIATGQVVKGINALKDNVTLAAGANITITPSGNTLTIASNTASVNAIINQTTQQAGANFNIGGTGTANVFSAATQYNIGAERALSVNGTNNLFVGVGSGQSTTLGSSNTFVGKSAGQGTTAGGDNSFFGTLAGVLNSTGGSNSFFGSNSGINNTTGSSNSFFGRESGFANNTGVENSFFGVSAGRANTTGFRNSFFGKSTGEVNSTGAKNSFFGSFAGSLNTTGADNSFFGFDSGTRNTSGIGNAFFGATSGVANTTGDFNSFFGDFTGFNNSTGEHNTFVGAEAGLNNTTGSFNTLIGEFAGVSTGNLTNATALGSGAVVNASNKVRIGNSSVTVIQGQVAYTFSSDKTQKENFVAVNGRDVLRKIRGFNMTSWNYKGQDPKQFRHYGPMAQDFYGAFGRDEIGSFGTPTTLNIGDVSGVMLTAIKELSVENETVKAENRRQQAQIDSLKQIVCSIRPKAKVCRRK